MKHFKKHLSVYLGMLYLAALCVCPAAAETQSGMTVATSGGMLAVRTSFSDTQDFVQQIGNLFTMNDPSRTSNDPVDFGRSYLLGKTEDIWSQSIHISQNQSTLDEATPLMINASYMGANHGQDRGMCVRAANHGLTYRDIGSRWIAAGKTRTGTDKSDIAWNLLRIIDGDTLLFLSDDAGADTSYTYNFYKDLNGAMTREETNATITPQAVTTVQVQPSVRHTAKTAYVYSGGVRLKVENGKSYTDCSRLVIDEVYDIINPTTVADAVRAGAPEGGYTQNPDLTEGGRSMLRYHVTYTVMPDGTVLTEADHEVLEEIRIDSYGLMQYQVKQDYAGGGIYRYLPNTKAFTAAKAGNTAVTETFDFSSPHPIKGNAASYPNSYVLSAQNDCVNGQYPNERHIDYFHNTSGQTVSAYTCGYLPVGWGASENRASAARGGFYFYNSLKAYPRLCEIFRAAAGTKIEAAGYKKLFLTEGEAGQSRYTIPYKGKLYTYIDMFQNGIEAELPDGYEIITKSANITTEGQKARAQLAEGDTHAYLVTVSDDPDSGDTQSALAVLTGITAESISEEPLDFVTKNLYLPTETSAEGVTLSWTSSDSQVVAEDGTVQRHMIERKHVTLTACVVSGSEALEKSFNITVLPRTTRVAVNEGFAHPERLGQSYNGVDGWTAAGTGAAELIRADNNYLLQTTQKKEYSVDEIAFRQNITDFAPGDDGSYTVSYRIRLPQLSDAMVRRIAITANGKTTLSAISVTSSGKLTVIDDLAAQPWYGTSAAPYTMVQAERWITVQTVIHTTDNTQSVYVDGALLAERAAMLEVPAQYDALGVQLQCRFAGSAGENSSVVWLDDLRIYAEDSKESYLAAMTDAEKVSFFASLLTLQNLTAEQPHEITQNLTLNAAYKAYDLTACGVRVDWETDAPSVISVDGVNGVVTQGEFSAKATLTATVTAGAVQKRLMFSFGVPVRNSSGIDDSTYAYIDFDSSAPAVANSTLTEDDAAHGRVLTVTNTTSGTEVHGRSNQGVYTPTGNVRCYFSCDVKFKGDDLNSCGILRIFGDDGTEVISLRLNYTKRTIDLIDSQAYYSGAVLTSANRYTPYDMPKDLAENEWMSVCIAYNHISRTYQVYINGTLINTIPHLKAYAHKESLFAFRGFEIAVSNRGTMYMDNFSARVSHDARADRADAALNAALLTYVSPLMHDALTTTEQFETAGPTSHSIHTSADVQKNPGLYTFGDSTTTLSYKIDGEAVTGFSADRPQLKTLEITAVCDGESKTKSLVRRTAPVSIDRRYDGKMVLFGETDGKTLVAASYQAMQKLCGVTFYDAAASEPIGQAADDGKTLTLYVWNSLQNLQPAAFSKILQ